MEELSNAEKVLNLLEKLNLDEKEWKEVTNLMSLYKKKEKKESQFAKQIFQSSDLYEEKPSPPPPPVDPKIDQEEVAYLATLNTFQWLAYPFIKTFVMVFCWNKWN